MAEYPDSLHGLWSDGRVSGTGDLTKGKGPKIIPFSAAPNWSGTVMPSGYEDGLIDPNASENLIKAGIQQRSFRLNAYCPHCGSATEHREVKDARGTVLWCVECNRARVREEVDVIHVDSREELAGEDI